MHVRYYYMVAQNYGGALVPQAPPPPCYYGLVSIWMSILKPQN